MSGETKSRNQSTKTLAIRGVLFNWVGRGCSFVITFVATPIILTALGDEGYGLWAIVMSMGSYYALADVGMQAACTKYIAEFEATGNRDATSRLFSTSILLYSIMAGVVLLVAVPVAWCFPFFFEIKQEPISEVRGAVFLTGVSVAIRLQAQVFVSTIKALKRFDISNAISVVVQITQAALMIWVVVAGYGLLGMAWVLVGTTLLSRAAEAYFATRLLGGIKTRLWTIDREMFGKVFRFSLWNVASQWSGRLHSQSAPFIIGIMLSPAVVPFYALANSLIQKAYSLTQGISSVVMPVASELDAQNRQASLLRVAVLSARVMVSIAVTGAVVVFFFGESFIDLWLGPGYSEQTVPVLYLLSLSFVANMTSGGIRSILAGMNRLDLVTKLNIIWAIGTVGMGVLMTHQFGVTGMAGAVLASSVLVNMGLCPYLTCQIIDYPWRRYVASVLLRPLLIAIPGVVTGAILDQFFGPPMSLWHWFAMASVLGVVMLLSVLLVCVDSETRLDVLSSLRVRSKPKRAPKAVQA